MDPNQLTQRSQEALQAAQTRAVELGHQEVDGEHLAAALLAEPDGLVPRLLTRAGIAVDTLAADLEQELARRPSVSGGA